MNRCNTCGVRYEDPYWRGECPLCAPMRELFGEKFGAVAKWVLTIAEQAGHDAVIGHLNDEEHP